MTLLLPPNGNFGCPGDPKDLLKPLACILAHFVLSFWLFLLPSLASRGAASDGAKQWALYGVARDMVWCMVWRGREFCAVWRVAWPDSGNGMV